MFIKHTQIIKEFRHFKFLISRMRRNSLMRIWPNTKIQKEQNKLKKLEKNFHSKISSLEKQIAQFKETLIQIKNSAQPKVDESLLLDINKAKENAEIEYQKILEDLKASELKIRQFSKNERYLKNELENQKNSLEIENRKLLQKVTKLLKANKNSEENWKISEENTIAREKIIKKLNDFLENLEKENRTQKEAIKLLKDENESYKEKLRFAEIQLKILSKDAKVKD